MDRISMDNLSLLRKELEAADRILVGAGAGLSAATRLRYFDRAVFQKQFPEMYRLGYRYQYEMVEKKDDEWNIGLKWAYHVQSPLHVEYGKNVYIGKNFLANYHLVIQDGAPIHIGNNVLIASNVTITTILHSMDAEKRIVQWVPQRFPKKHKGLYVKALPITIGNNVWICSNVTICAGVTIGDNTVIGAGSVVTQDIPSGFLACGTPCKVIRPIAADDKIMDSTVRGNF